MVAHMVAVGEETGQLEHMLSKVADFYEAEVDAKVKALTSLLEPVMICFVGGIVGFIVISMYLPIFTPVRQDPLRRHQAALLDRSRLRLRFALAAASGPDSMAKRSQGRDLTRRGRSGRCRRSGRRSGGSASRLKSVSWLRGTQAPRFSIWAAEIGSASRALAAKTTAQLAPV